MMRPLLLAGSLALLAGCTTSNDLGVPPKLSPVNYHIGDERSAAFPDKPSGPVHRFSLWNDKQSRLFTDPRAFERGDILTVLISINDQAKLKNENDLTRSGQNTLGVAGSFGIGKQSGSANGKLTSNGDSTFQGNGHTTRSEDIKLSVAAVVTSVMPNGNLIIRGSQEVRVNDELRVLTIAGIVRPTDINSDNTISYDRIAEARISYGGRGRISEVQQPAWGQQVWTRVSPF